MKLYILVFLLIKSMLLNAQEYKLDGNEVKTETQIQFQTGTDKMATESNAALEAIKKYLTDKAYISLLRVECHTDNTGDEKANQLLSEKRALAVCKALVKMGVDCKRLIAVGFGSTKPIADNAATEGKAANRRINFINAALRNHPIGGMPIDGGGKVAGDSCN